MKHDRGGGVYSKDLGKLNSFTELLQSHKGHTQLFLSKYFAKIAFSFYVSNTYLCKMYQDNISSIQYILHTFKRSFDISKKKYPFTFHNNFTQMNL